jgi:TonB family protein
VFFRQKGIFMLRKILFTVLVCYHTTTSADFLTALQAYQKKDYATAQTEFSALLPVGNEQAAFNLAAMAMNGQGQVPDQIKALAYFDLAANLGHTEAYSYSNKLKPTLTADESKTALALLEQLTNSLLITNSIPSVKSTEPTAIQRFAPDYPIDAALQGLFGYVTVRYLVDEQGTVLAVDSLDSFPAKVFERAAMKAVKRWRYQPTGKKQLGTVKMTFSMGPLQQTALQKWLEKYQIWSYAMAGSPEHQEGLGSLLHLLAHNSGVTPEFDDNAEFSTEALPEVFFSQVVAERPQQIEHFQGYAKVEVNDQGIVTKILGAKNQQTYTAAELLLQKKLPNVNSGGVYNLIDQLDNKVVISKVVTVNPLYSYYYWWKTAAKNGDLRAQRFLAAHDQQWENYLLSKNDPQVQTWVGARMLLDGESVNGKALLAKAQQQKYPLALELKDTL